MLRTLLLILLGLPALAILLHTVVRVVRYFYKFPMPQFLANLIDNPLRRKIQSPSEMPLRHHIEPSMTVLDVGPGNGRYTIETARRVGPTGKVIARAANFRIKEKSGNFFAYTLVFEKDSEKNA